MIGKLGKASLLQQSLGREGAGVWTGIGMKQGGAARNTILLSRRLSAFCSMRTTLVQNPMYRIVGGSFIE